jgi:hypothetical protein
MFVEARVLLCQWAGLTARAQPEGGVLRRSLARTGHTRPQLPRHRAGMFGKVRRVRADGIIFRACGDYFHSFGPSQLGTDWEGDLHAYCKKGVVPLQLAFKHVWTCIVFLR